MASVFSFPRKRSTPPEQPTTSTDSLRQARTGNWVLADPAHYIQGALAATRDDELENLNAALELLVEVFPDVQAEVFREMLSKLSRQSRVEVITERLLKEKGKWVRGRHHTPAAAEAEDAARAGDASPVARNLRSQRFRHRSYQRAVKDACYAEFRGLSHGSIKAVLAEHNFSYADSRPVLHALSTRSWRFYLVNFWNSRRSEDDVRDAEKHPLISWYSPNGADGPRMAFLKPTASDELNGEIYDAYIAPLLRLHLQKSQQLDAALATKLAMQDAEENAALFECQCCYDSVMFEEVTGCSHGDHIFCNGCVRRTMEEALYGQGWDKTARVETMSMQCLAPGSEEEGCFVSAGDIKNALIRQDHGRLWLEFEDRVARYNYTQCQLQVLRCPFCPYAEVEELPAPTRTDAFTSQRRTWQMAAGRLMLPIDHWILVVILPLWCILHELLWCGILLLRYLDPTTFEAARVRISHKRQGLRFRCQNPRCTKASCIRCLSLWRDPHVCFEERTTSLRQAIEAATTAAIKRVCPSCQTAFVRSSGCNKMTCPCGYKMCYVCRAVINDEGYTHFCQHFRELGGACRECSRCDLYASPDEDKIIQEAADEAEKAWRRREQDGKSALSDERIGMVKKEMLKGRRIEHGGEWHGVLDGLLEAMLA